jgi:hypothetical protein
MQDRDMTHIREELLRLEIEADILQLRATRDLAEELVRARGWSEKDDDFWFQVEDEAKRQWEEGMDRERRKQCLYDRDFQDAL